MELLLLKTDLDVKAVQVPLLCLTCASLFSHPRMESKFPWSCTDELLPPPTVGLKLAAAQSMTRDPPELELELPAKNMQRTLDVGPVSNARAGLLWVPLCLQTVCPSFADVWR